MSREASNRGVRVAVGIGVALIAIVAASAPRASGQRGSNRIVVNMGVGAQSLRVQSRGVRMTFEQACSGVAAGACGGQHVELVANGYGQGVLRAVTLRLRARMEGPISLEVMPREPLGALLQIESGPRDGVPEGADRCGGASLTLTDTAGAEQETRGSLQVSRWDRHNAAGTFQVRFLVHGDAQSVIGSFDLRFRASPRPPPCPPGIP